MYQTKTSTIHRLCQPGTHFQVKIEIFTMQMVDRCINGVRVKLTLKQVTSEVGI